MSMNRVLLAACSGAKGVARLNMVLSRSIVTSAVSSSSSSSATSSAAQSRSYSSRPNKSSNHSNSTSFSGAYEEPEFGVTDDETFDPTGVKIPYLPDHVRVEMYQLHKQDPEQWTDEALAKRFAASLTRTRGVLVLMAKREALRKELLGTEDGSVPPEWAIAYARHREDPAKYTAEVLFQEMCAAAAAADKAPAAAEAKVEAEGEEGAAAGTDAAETPAAPAAPTSSGPKRLTTITSAAAMADVLRRMDEHTSRWEDQEHHTTLMEESLQRLADYGVDTRFRELREGKDMNSITGYSPRLIGDELDAYKVEMQRLKAKILSQTSALPTKKAADVDKELMTHEDRLKHASEDMKNAADVKFDHFNRWKFAFKDTAPEHRGVKPTMIRTRSGAFRPANPLEELGRSWYGKKPNFMDRELLYRTKYEKYADPDQDEGRVKTFHEDRKKRRAALKEAFEAAK